MALTLLVGCGDDDAAAPTTEAEVTTTTVPSSTSTTEQISDDAFVQVVATAMRGRLDTAPAELVIDAGRGICAAFTSPPTSEQVEALLDATFGPVTGEDYTAEDGRVFLLASARTFCPDLAP
jgi:hypothetical protein